MMLCRSAVVALLLGLAAGAFASATPDEFRRCHVVAIEYLQQCVDRQPGYQQKPCWTDARQRQEVCYRSVRERYSVDTNRRNAEAAARRELDAKNPR